jgi:hypothetical protein
MDELEWLIEQGIVFGPETLFTKDEMLSNEEFRNLVTEEADHEKGLDKLKWQGRWLDQEMEFLGFSKEDPIYKSFEEKHRLAYIYWHEIRRRQLSVALRQKTKATVVPIFADDLALEHGTETQKAEVVQITLSHLPVPDEKTPWEQIIEYRGDPDSRSKFLALRHWMSEVARSEITPAEVEEKLEYLIDQYNQHLKLHRMKTNAGTLETVVTTSAEVLGDLVSFKWGKAAEALFSLKRRQVELLEGELTAPGSEIAYIVKARETFSAS